MGERNTPEGTMGTEFLETEINMNFTKDPFNYREHFSLFINFMTLIAKINTHKENTCMIIHGKQLAVVDICMYTPRYIIFIHYYAHLLRTFKVGKHL